MNERARTILDSIRAWIWPVGSRTRAASDAVILHDPASQQPHDLDDPFFDPKVQARMAETITNAAQKK
jgi:hypothetical protein